MSSDIAAVVDWRDVLLRRGGCRVLEARAGPLAEEVLQQPNWQPRTEAQQAALRHSEEEGEGEEEIVIHNTTHYTTKYPLLLNLKEEYLREMFNGRFRI